MHWNDLQKTFPLSYYTSKSQQAENYLVLPIKLMINRFKSQSATDHQIITWEEEGIVTKPQVYLQ